MDSRLGGTEIAKPSYPSQGQCGSRFITSCTMDSQFPASTASQMHNTDNIDSSHGEGSENGDLNNDSSLHFKDLPRSNFNFYRPLGPSPIGFSCFFMLSGKVVKGFLLCSYRMYSFVVAVLKLGLIRSD